MDDRSFLAGLELGKFLSRFSRLESRVDTLDRRVGTIETRARRIGILTALWTLALVTNASPDKVAEVGLEIVRHFSKRS